MAALAVAIGAASIAPALTIYSATIDASLIPQAPIINQFGFAAYQGVGIDNGSSFGTAFDAGSTQVFQAPGRIRGVTSVNGSTDLPSGVSEHSATTTGHLNLENLSKVAPFAPTLTLTWSFTLTVSCTLADEVAIATVSASVPGGPALAPVSLTQIGIGTQTVTINGSMAYNPSIPAKSIVAQYLDVHADGFSITPPVPEPASFAALGLGALGLLKRRRKA